MLLFVSDSCDSCVKFCWLLMSIFVKKLFIFPDVSQDFSNPQYQMPNLNLVMITLRNPNNSFTTQNCCKTRKTKFNLSQIQQIEISYIFKFIIQTFPMHRNEKRKIIKAPYQNKVQRKFQYK